MRVLIADDSMLLREGVSRLLADEHFDVVAQVASAEELLRCVEAEAPDVAVVDIRMPPTHTDEGLVAAETIRRQWPSVGVLVLSQYIERPSTHCACSRVANNAAAICSKTACSTRASSPMRCAA